MKPLLFVLLAASLIANVALVVLSRRSAPPASAVSTPTLAAGSSAPAAAPNQSGGSTVTTRPIPQAWAGTRTDQDLHRLVAGLRTAGYPPAVIRAIISQLLTERFASRQPNAGQPFWKRNLPTPETAAAQAALNNERQSLFEIGRAHV